MSVIEQFPEDTEPSPACLHLLQNLKFTDYNGPAPVSEYFHVSISERHKSKDLEILESAFRGRALTGAEIKVPHGFHGSILERREENEPTLESSDESPQRCKTGGSWKVTGRFDRFLYWNHDLLPNKSDSIHRAMEWPDLAAALHRPIDPDAVQKALQDMSKE